MLARDGDIDAALEALARGMTQKMLHGAMAELRNSDVQARERASNAIQHFFLRNEK
jgi:glutamyl-tRNA reductase